MTILALDYPLGRPYLPSVAVRRARAITRGATIAVHEGDPVRADSLIAEGKDGQRIWAGVTGRVVEVAADQVIIEGSASIMAGVVGVGESAVGPISFLARGESVAVVPIPIGGLIVFPQRLPLTLMQRAANNGAAGIIAASASAIELEGFVRTDLTALLDGLVPDTGQAPIPIMLTEGLGDHAMDPVFLGALTQQAGAIGMLSGRTQPQRTIRPELLTPPQPGVMPVTQALDASLVVGCRVRVISGALQGAHGELIYLFGRQQFGPNAMLTQSARLRLEDGSTRIVPVGVLDRIG